MSVYKRGRIYYFSFWHDGQHIQKSTRQGNPRKARQAEAKYRAALIDGELELKKKTPAPTLKAFAQRFIDAIQVRCAAKPKTIEFYAQQLRRLLEYSPLADSPLDKISEGLIEAFVQRRIQTVCPASVNRSLATLRRLLRLAYDWRVIDRVPKITLLPGERIREFVLSYAEEARYLNATPQPLRDVATLILDTGFRVGEALSLEWKDVHFEPAQGSRFGFIHIAVGKSKYAKRNISLTARVRGMLEGRFNGDEGWVFAAPEEVPMLVSSLDHVHAGIRKALEMDPEFVLHSLRHTALTRLGAAGVDVFTLQRIAGHSSITMTEKYVHPTPMALEDAIGKLDAANRALEPENRQPAVAIPATVEVVESLELQ
jgi:integrase